jgi:hypothetical protein
MEAIEHWPWEVRGNPPIETIVSGDGVSRLHFVHAPGGTVRFFVQELRRLETMGQEYFAWYSEALSGLYPDLETAKQDARRMVRWFNPAS